MHHESAVIMSWRVFAFVCEMFLDFDRVVKHASCGFFADQPATCNFQYPLLANVNNRSLLCLSTTVLFSVEEASTEKIHIPRFNIKLNRRPM